MAVLEYQRLGGTCVNVGCVPKKVMWNAATLAEHLHDYNGYGFQLLPKETLSSFNWSQLKEKRDAYVLRLNGIYERNLGSSQVTVFQGRAKFLSPTSLQVGDQVVTGDRTLIATGGYPAVPNIPGAELGITR